MVPWGRHDGHDKDGEGLDRDVFKYMGEGFFEACSPGDESYYQITIVWFDNMKHYIVVQLNSAMLVSGSVHLFFLILLPCHFVSIGSINLISQPTPDKFQG